MNNLHGFEELNNDEAMLINGGSEFLMTTFSTAKVFIENILNKLTTIPVVGLVAAPVNTLWENILFAIFNFGSNFVDLPNKKPSLDDVNLL